MKTLNRKEALRQFEENWQSMSEEWFKLEVLQDYSGEDKSESLALWKQGEKERSVGLFKSRQNAEWVKDYRKKSDQGVRLLRLHIVEKPHTQYLEWEIEHYKHINIPICGEEVYRVDKEDVTHLEIPSGDMMIFDKQKVVVNQYNEEGLMMGATFYEKGDNISSFLSLREELLRYIQPI
jgi:hypothetical protein